MTDETAPKRRKLFGPILLLVLLIVLVGAGLITWYCYPKKVVFDNGFAGHYRGFGLSEERAFWGRHYYQIDLELSVPEDGPCTLFSGSPAKMTEDGRELYRFVAHYPDGAVSAEGFCELPKTGQLSGGKAYSAISDPVEAVYYHPSGSPSSRVDNRTGVETFWTHRGTKVWERHLEDGVPTKLTKWHRNGQLQAVYRYRDGKKHGLVEFYKEDGSLKGTILFEEGFEKERGNAGKKPATE